VKIPYVNIANQNLAIKQKLVNAAERVIEHGQLINGPEVSILETKLAKYLGVDNVVSVSNGTAALYLSLRGLGIGIGDEVITVANSYLATVSSIVLTGATPVLVDVDSSMNMDPNLLEKVITNKTKAILPVHLTGKPAMIEEICEIAQKYNLHVIEDAAQAIGAQYKGRKIGSFGKTACFSLHPLKNLSALGDGGFVATNDKELANWISKARNHGHSSRDECEFWSFNMRLDTIQASFLLEKLPLLEKQIECRRRNAIFFREHILNKHICLPKEEDYERCVNHLFVIRLKERDKMKKYLESNGIETKIHYPIPIHKLKASNMLNFKLPRTEEYSDKILSLPVYPELTSNHLEKIVELINAFE
tara:strand:+ start:891 stop:1976 length:1086 start_codon:yes stop_codon:yes gene_type:complete